MNKILKGALKLIILSTLSTNAQTTINENGFKIVSEKQIQGIHVVKDAVYFTANLQPLSQYRHDYFVSLDDNQLYKGYVQGYDDFTNPSTDRWLQIFNGKMVRNFCRFEKGKVRCEKEDTEKDITKVEVNTSGSIDTYNKVFDNLIISGNKWAFKARSEYTKKACVFIDSPNSEPLKVEVASGNEYIKDATIYKPDWYLSDFYSYGGASDFVVIHARPGYETDVLCVFEIRNGKIEQIVSDADEIVGSNKITFASKRCVVLPNENIIIIKELKNQPKFRVSLYSRGQGGKYIKKWKIELNNFLDISTVACVDEQLILGGTSKDGGYLGYLNPHIKILERLTGKVKKEYYVPSKYGTIKNIQRCLTSRKASPDGKRISDYNNGDLIITCGYYIPYPYEKNLGEEEASEGIVIRDYLNPDGTFYNNLFNK